MTVQTNTNSIAYVGNGSTVHFDYDFLILDSAHLRVYFDSVLQTSGYVVSGVGSQGGGTVAFAAPPANGVGINLVRDVPFYQLTDYQPYDAFPADTHERALDLLTMMAQQLKDELGRTIQHPVGGNKWDAEGNEIINVGTGNSGTSATNVDQVKYIIASEVGDDPSSSASIRSREALRRSYAEAGYVLVAGSFEVGGTLTSASDVLLQESGGKAYSGAGPYPQTVSPGTDPTTGGGYTDRSGSIYGVTTVTSLAEGRHSIGSVVKITDRGGATATVQAGGAANGFDILDAGNGNTAVLIHSGDVKAEWFGSTQAALEAAYAFDSVTISTPYTVNNFNVAKPTKFIGLGKLTATGTLTLTGQITAPPKMVIDSAGVTAWVITGNLINEIQAEWFSNGVGVSVGAGLPKGTLTIQGIRAGVKMVGANKGYGTFYGYRAGELCADAAEGAFVGTFAGASCLSAIGVTGIGYGALRGKEAVAGSGVFNNTTALNTVAIGAGTFQDGTSHSTSVAVGAYAGRNMPTSVSVVTIGYNSAINAGPLSGAVIIGTSAANKLNQGLTVTDSTDICVVGNGAAQDMTRGKRITAVGPIAARYSSDADDLTLVGYLTGPSSSATGNVTRSICLGSSARGDANDTITIGNNLINNTAGRMYLGDATTVDVVMRGVYPQTNAAAANVYIDSAGKLYRSTSSEQFKDIIEPVQLEWAYKVLGFESFLYKPTQNAVNEAWTYYGFSAEQVAQVDPRYAQMDRKVIGTEVIPGSVTTCVEFDKDGNEIEVEIIEPDRTVDILADEYTPSGVMYDRVSVAHNMIIKDLLARIEELEAKLN